MFQARSLNEGLDNLVAKYFSESVSLEEDDIITEEVMDEGAYDKALNRANELENQTTDARHSDISTGNYRKLATKNTGKINNLGFATDTQVNFGVDEERPGVSDAAGQHQKSQEYNASPMNGPSGFDVPDFYDYTKDKEAKTKWMQAHQGPDKGGIHKKINARMGESITEEVLEEGLNNKAFIIQFKNGQRYCFLAPTQKEAVHEARYHRGFEEFGPIVSVKEEPFGEGDGWRNLAQELKALDIPIHQVQGTATLTPSHEEDAKFETDECFEESLTINEDADFELSNAVAHIAESDYKKGIRRNKGDFDEAFEKYSSMIDKFNDSGIDENLNSSDEE